MPLSPEEGIPIVKTKQRPATAYSYLRFSHPEQAKGDSLRRQMEKRDAWLKRNGVALDASLSMEDRGVSAFTGEHRDNADRHALAAFLALVKQGRIAKGSFLIVESLDRLSREDIIPALSLLLELIQGGIRVVQLSPAETVYDSASNPMHLMMAIMELSRGHSESAMKSERVGAAWREKKRRAAADREPLTSHTPYWLRMTGGCWEVIGDAAAAVKRIFRLAIDGYGLGVITKKLNAEGVPPIGRAKYWAKSYVAKIVNNRAAVGEYQPHTGGGKKRRPEGDPIPGYYPAVVSEEEWFAARAALSNRRQKAGRIGKSSINVFANLLHDARDGGPLHRVDKGKKGGGPTLVSYRASQGTGRYVSFPLVVFERAVLSCLREIDPRDVLPKNDYSGERVLSLSGRLQAVADQKERIKAKLLHSPDVDSLVDVLRTLEEKQKALGEQLSGARQEAASPATEAWGQCRSLIDALDNAPDPEKVRVRLRAAVRRVVESVWVLTVPRGKDRLAAVQVWFAAGGKRRDYLIYHQTARGGFVASRPSSWSVRSLAGAHAPCRLDLRKPEDATALEAALAEMDLAGRGATD
jgi:DNA invertase Pin-like site-specific DNA recombinase